MYNNIVAIKLKKNLKHSKLVEKLKLLREFQEDEFNIDFKSKFYGFIKAHKSNPDLFLIGNKIYNLDGRTFIGILANNAVYKFSDFTDEQHYSKDDKFIGIRHKTNPNIYYNEVTEELYDESTDTKTKIGELK